jgi:formylglycine-generating enzyme
MDRLCQTFAWALGLMCASVATSCILGDFKKGSGPGGLGQGGSGGSGSAGMSGTAGKAGASGAGGGASGEACLGTTCEDPPANTCEDSAHLRAYDTTGSCIDGTCSYVSQVVECDCSGNACTSDPCGAVTCETPPAPACPGPHTSRTFASIGTCSGGSCSYTPTDIDCDTNEMCSGGECLLCNTEARCGPDCTACSGDTPACKDLGTSSECVACTESYPCEGPGSYCNPLTDTCVYDGCTNLDRTCGDGTEFCCLRMGAACGDGPFNRGNDPLFPATLSGFTAEKFEVTVGRFRSFVGAYSQTMIKSGRGQNLDNEADLGWDTAWNQYLPEDALALMEALKCEPSSHTWTDSPGSNENKPINCVTWYEAYAFCIWDSGRLLTEAEWNCLAAGGDLQRPYPWGTAVPGADAEYAAYGGYYYGTSEYDGVLDIAPVGAIAGGQSRQGHMDLAGNVEEWVLDTFEPYQVPCDDCANLSPTPGAGRVVRGGGWNSSVTALSTAHRIGHAPDSRSSQYGIRCAGL